MDAYGILVIILSITLAILLVICIILGVGLIKLTNQVRDIMVKADDIMEDVESVSNFFKKTATSISVAGIIGNIVSVVTGHNKKGKKGDE